MKILVTGARGFVGRNLCAQLKNIKEGKARYYDGVSVDEVYEYDVDCDEYLFDTACRNADFVFNLAGVNRPIDISEYHRGNFNFAENLLSTLKKNGNKCPVMLSSSSQASLISRYTNSDYGRSKKDAEDLFFKYSKETGAEVFVYRFPNLFGKWCRPNYNSAVATFCYNIANDLPIQVHDSSVELELLYIDDLVDDMISMLNCCVHRCNFDGLKVVPSVSGKYCYCPITYNVRLIDIVAMLNDFNEHPNTLTIPEIAPGSFEKKLYSTFLSYLPEKKIKFTLKMNVDHRGSFTEVLKTLRCGQFSVNVSKPGSKKGQHWHNSKWELFIVVKGSALIEEREIGTSKVLRFEVNGDKMEVVYMLPGYTHSIVNLSATDDLITLMWSNEVFDYLNPDTYSEDV